MQLIAKGLNTSNLIKSVMPAIRLLLLRWKATMLPAYGHKSLRYLISDNFFIAVIDQLSDT